MLRNGEGRTNIVQSSIAPPLNSMENEITTRSTKKIVTFTNSFSLIELEEPLPLGSYTIETEEELLESLSFQAYRRIQTLLHLPAISGEWGGVSRIVVIDPNGLDDALKQDQDQYSHIKD